MMLLLSPPLLLLVLLQLLLLLLPLLLLLCLLPGFIVIFVYFLYQRVNLAHTQRRQPRQMKYRAQLDSTQLNRAELSLPEFLLEICT